MIAADIESAPSPTFQKSGSRELLLTTKTISLNALQNSPTLHVSTSQLTIGFNLAVAGLLDLIFAVLEQKKTKVQIDLLLEQPEAGSAITASLQWSTAEGK